MLRVVVLSVFIIGCFGSVLKGHPPLPDAHIVGGVEVDIRHHPHQLSLQTTGHICGASIISSEWAVTAAHCVGSPASRYSLRAGTSIKNLGTRYLIDTIVIHPNFNRVTIDHDIALLKINGAFSFGSNVQPVKLAEVEAPAGTMVNVTGWGAIKQGGMTSTQLMRVSIPIVNRAKCGEVYKDMNVITSRMICAGYTEGGKDSCQGDSGGPLTGNGTLYGIVSWGFGCAKPKYPGVYTNVANLRPWIKKISGV